MKFNIPHDKVWLRPDTAYFEAQSQVDGIDSIELEWNGKYKRIREMGKWGQEPFYNLRENWENEFFHPPPRRRSTRRWLRVFILIDRNNKL